LTSNGTTWTSAAGGGGGGSPGGSNTQVQFNDSGSFGGDSGLTYNKTTDVLTVSGGAVLQGLTAGRGAGAIATNTAFGNNALNANTTGSSSVAIGSDALSKQTIGTRNTCVGEAAGREMTTGGSNSLIGIAAGVFLTTGTKNTVLYSITTGGEPGALAAGSSNVVSIGTPDQEVFRFTSTLSTQLDGLNAGRGAGRSNTNVAFGNNALNANTTGSNSVAIGSDALGKQTIGTRNTCVGESAGREMTTGGSNSLIGTAAGYLLTTGTKNIVLYSVTTGLEPGGLSAGSVGVVSIGTPDQEVFRFTSTLSTQLDGMTAGRGAGRINRNVAFGSNALISNTTGKYNVAIGGGNSNEGALEKNTIGEANIAIGSYALIENTTGSSNTCIGLGAGLNVTTGQKNLSVYGGDGNVGNRLGGGSTGIVSIGTFDAERLRIETAAFRAQLVYDQTTGSAANVFVASDGKMSRSTSSQRYKKNIQDAVHGLEKVLQLRSVTFNHINPDEAGIVYGGLIAEEVHDLGLTEFVEYTWDGRPDSLRYGHMVSLLVKAVQELNARVVALETQGV
jgi:hypothetical protein